MGSTYGSRPTTSATSCSRLRLRRQMAERGARIVGGELRRAQGRASSARRSPMAGQLHQGAGLAYAESKSANVFVRARGDGSLESRQDLRQRGAPRIGADRAAAVPRRGAEAPDRLHPARRLPQPGAQDRRAGRGHDAVGGHRARARGTRRPRARGLRRGTPGRARHASLVGLRRERRRSPRPRADSGDQSLELLDALSAEG